MYVTDSVVNQCRFNTEYSGPSYSRSLSSSHNASNNNNNNQSSPLIQENEHAKSLLAPHAPPHALIQPPRKFSNRELVLLIVCCVLMFVVVLLFVIVLVNTYNTRKSSTENYFVSKSGENRCLTRVCLRATSQLLDSINTSVESMCQTHIQSFLCGQWLSSTNRIPPTIVSWDFLEQYRYSQQEILRDIIESRNDQHQQKDSPSNQYISKLQDAFELCMDRDLHSDATLCVANSNEKLGQSFINPLVTFSQINLDSLDKLLQFTQINLSMPVIFQSRLVMDPEKSSLLVLLSEYDDPILPSLAQMEDVSQVQSLLEYIDRVADLSHIPTNQKLDLQSDFIRMLKLLRRLCKTCSTDNQMPAQKPWKPTRITIDNLNKATRHSIDFLSYIRHFVNMSWPESDVSSTSNTASPMTPQGSPHITMSTEVLVSDIEYFVGISSIILQSKLSYLKNFILFSVIHKYGPYLSLQISVAKQNYIWRGSGRQHPYESWQDCIELLNGPGMSGIHSLAWKGSKSISTQMILAKMESSIMKYIKLAIREIVDDIQFSDISDKSQLIEKIISVKLWTLDTSYDSLNSFYSKWNIERNQSFLVAISNVFLSSIRLHPSQHEKYSASNGIKTYSKLTEYLQNDNLISLSSLLFQWPFYSHDTSIPKYLEFATLGWWLIKPFEDIIKLAFSSNYSYRKYQKLYILKQLNPTNNLTIEELFGKYSTNEIYSTVFAISALKRTYEKYQIDVYNQEHILPHLKLSSKQIFFIKLGQNFCALTRSEFNQQLIGQRKLTYQHQLLILSMMKSFQKQFPC